MSIRIESLQNNPNHSFFLLAGPCVVEGEAICMDIAGKVNEMCQKLGIPYVFKASYKKANRTRIDSFTGIGDRHGLEIIQKVGRTYQIPTVTDIHESGDAVIAAEYVDILQIPAFLCRQTDLLVAAAKTGKIVNVKKGQFSSPESMQHAIRKITDSGNDQVMLTDRGTQFGYGDLIVDYRGLVTMRNFGVPVVMDATHSLQQPNQSSGITGGRPDMIETICRAAIAVGADGLFIETHPNPAEAKSDGANMLHLNRLEPLLERLMKLRQTVAEISTM
ncbi:MAG TPA: 3-deoxy-8-phosphooctulonate synthase [Luteibaculaceae bacterium]|nr:3-deoxy-8-phosphooctulonate synthase [Luteibaculaceae bacterium]